MRHLALMLMALAPTSALAGPSIGSDSSGKDADGDGVPNAADLCPGSDDSVDLDGNGAADCVETFVSDAGFDAAGSTAQWVHVNQTVGWSSDDGNGYASSGSMPLDIGPGAAGTWGVHGDCVVVSPSTQHTLLMQWDLASSTGSADARLMVWEYADTACTSNVNSMTLEHLTVPTAGFETVGGTFTTKPSTGAVYLGIFNAPPSGDIDAQIELRVDNVLLHDTPAAMGDDDETGKE